MQIYRWENQCFRELDLDMFTDESDLEDMLAADATPILGQPICIIGRQANIGRGQQLDLLALDRQGNTIIIELKSRRATRTAVAQVLEYAATISKFAFIDLEHLAYEWSQQTGVVFTSLTDLHASFFGYHASDVRSINFNRRQKMVLIAEGGTERVLEIVTYLRQHNIDFAYLSYASYRGGKETILATKTFLGQPMIRKSDKKYHPPIDNQLMTKQRFLSILSINQSLHQVATQFFDYVETCGGVVRPRQKMVRLTIGGMLWIRTYPSLKGRHFRIDLNCDFSPSQIAIHRQYLPNTTRRKFGLSFNITSDTELAYAIEVFDLSRLSILDI